MATLLKLLGAVVACLAAYGASQFVLPALTGSPKFENVQQQIDYEVPKIKKSLPIKAHNLVTWTDIEGGNKKIVFKYKVRASGEILSRAREQIETELKKQMKNLPAKCQEFLKQGVKFHCIVYDENDQYALQVWLP